MVSLYPQRFARKNGKTSMSSGAKKIESHNLTFFGTRRQHWSACAPAYDGKESKF